MHLITLIGNDEILGGLVLPSLLLLVAQFSVSGLLSFLSQFAMKFERQD